MPVVRLDDPHDAFDGDSDGLGHFKRLAGSLEALLGAETSAFLQVGYEQLPQAHAVFRQAGYFDRDVLRGGYGFPMGLRVGPRSRSRR